MLGSLFDNSTLPMLEQMVSFTQARHGVLAGNVANLDTPGYHTRDLPVAEFQEQLKQAIKESRSESQRAPYQSPGSYSTPQTEKAQAPWAAKELKDYKGMLRHDDNNSSLEEQVTEIAKNHAQHNLALSLMTAQFRLLRAAITERA
jgi:flagellar basal-body rod protein FlgB